jgi:hypothetical protein
MRRPILFFFAAAAVTTSFYACVEPPPKIASIPSNGLALRVHVFGASAYDARSTIEAVKENNKSFKVVTEGGDGEVLLGLENDSPHCVAPTALCSYKIAMRIKDRKGTVVHQSVSTVQASAERCADLCSKALNNVAVKVVETAASVLGGGAPAGDASVEGVEGGELALADAAPVVEAGSPAKAKKGPPAPKAEPPKATPVICAVGSGARLPSEEAEKRTAQVEALKRLGVLEQDEYDCLRKAYLDRL